MNSLALIQPSTPAEQVRLTELEARRLTDEVRADAQALWRKLVSLHTGGAHLALGYASWHAYCAAEFGIGQSHAYRLLDAGRVAEAIPQLGNEAQARELARLLRSEGAQAMLEVYDELLAEYGDELTASLIGKFVHDRIEGKRRRDARQPSDAAKAALRALEGAPRISKTEQLRRYRAWRIEQFSDSEIRALPLFQALQARYDELEKENQALRELAGVLRLQSQNGAPVG